MCGVDSGAAPYDNIWVSFKNSSDICSFNYIVVPFDVQILVLIMEEDRNILNDWIVSRVWRSYCRYHGPGISIKIAAVSAPESPSLSQSVDCEGGFRVVPPR